MTDQVFSSDVKYFESNKGARIFQIPLQEFPILWGYSYLALVEDSEIGEYRVLIDTGSGFGDSNQYLEQGLNAVSKEVGETIGMADLTHVFITHGHIDHFGGLPYIRPRTPARIGVHELDLRNLTNHEERLTIISRRLRNFLLEAGVPLDRCDQLIDLYMITKSLYQSVEVDFTYEAAGMRVGPFEMLHVPGHCAGHVAIRLHDVLFCGDHVLGEITPHQSPEHLTLSTGLDHYLKSLESLRTWASGVRVTLAGHNKPIFDLPVRLDAIQKAHCERLEHVLNFMGEPHTIRELSQDLFGEVHGYNVLLALEETGAHVEYLYQRGLLGIENLDDLENDGRPIPIRYCSLTK